MMEKNINVKNNTTKDVKNNNVKNVFVKAQILELGKATELVLGNGNKRSERNGTPQITNIERCVA